MLDILEYLTEKNLNPRPAGDGNVRCLCPFHEEQEGKPGRLYVQTDDEDRWGLLFCLAGETRVITKEGTFEIKDLVGTSPELLVAKNGPSTWKHAPIKSFGKQKLMAVNLSRNGIKKTIRATPEHRWFVKAGKKHDKRRELTTAELKPRHRLCESRAQSVADMGVDISHHGIVRGFIYGDGTMPNNTTGSVAYFYGAKDLALTSYFPSQKLVPQGPDCVAMRSFPAFYKAERPALTENKAYLYGWLAGYFAADGCYTATCDTPILHSANREDLEYVRDLCNVLGIGTYGIGEQTRRGFGKEDSEIYNVRFSVKNLSEDFFIIESHKERFKASTKYDRLGWVVESIEDLDIEEEVYCAVVENYGNFTLEDNILTGNCFVCGVRGSINKLRKFYGDSTVDFTPLESANPIIEVAAQYYSERLFDNIDQYLYLEDRGLEEATIVQARLGYADGNLGAHLLQRGYTPEEIKETGLIRKDGSDYFKDEIIFPCLQYGRAMQLRGKKTQGMKGVPTILYNSDSIIGEDTVYICEGEMDTLTLQQMGFNTIDVPGVHNWKDEWTEEINEAKRVYIVFDQDKAGISGAEKTASKLGSKSRIVKLPAKGIDVNDWYVKFGKRREDFEWLFSQAKGGLLVSVAQAYDKWTQIEGNADLVGLRFNISALDKPMSYGQLPGQVIVTLARTDAGKSIDAINKMVRNRLADDKFKCLFISLEQTRNEVFERLYRIHNFYFPGSSVFDVMEYWKNNLLIVDKNRISEGELIDCIEQHAYEAGSPANKIIVDYLGYYARSFTGNAKERTSEAIMGLKRIAKEFDTVIETPVQANRTGEIGESMSFDMAADAAEVEHTANIMMALWRPEQKLQKDPDNSDVKPGDVYTQIIKSKNGGSGAIARYHFAPLTLAMVPYDDPLYDLAIKERSYAVAGDTWLEATKRRLSLDMSI